MLRESNSPGDCYVRIRSPTEILYEVRNKVSNWDTGRVTTETPTRGALMIVGLEI